MNKFFDVRTPFMKPLWRRILFTTFTVGWGFFELANGATMFGLIFLAAGGFLIRELFIKFDEDEWDAEFAARDAAEGRVPAAKNDGDSES
ncbi:hypothetical protein [Celeribacter sp.]|uniref:hypothetical protein n=1 Tax=Celeribacter sp. TaxID=1890673 RepID=UPI003A9458FE